MLHVALPIGISFYTFTQIAFLVDCWQGKVHERSFIHYVLFVTYFPHLIAGPVLHHAQMMPQFANPAIYRIDANKLALGIAIFTFGLAKKLLIGDKMGQYADLMFNGVHNGMRPRSTRHGSACWPTRCRSTSTFRAIRTWRSACPCAWACSCRSIFDLPTSRPTSSSSGGAGTFRLSTFLRDYLYVPLGGNRKGEARRYLNLFLTMLLGGLWHGAAWTFVIWGALHGAFLMVNHLWNAKVRPNATPSRLRRAAGWFLTFLCVMIAWVVFRAESVATALEIYKGMLGMHGGAVERVRRVRSSVPQARVLPNPAARPVHLPGIASHDRARALGAWSDRAGGASAIDAAGYRTDRRLCGRAVRHVRVPIGRLQPVPLFPVLT